MLVALQVASVLSIMLGAGLVGLLLTATRGTTGTHVLVDLGFSGLSLPLDIGLCWGVAVACITFGVLALGLTIMARRQNWNAKVRADVQALVRAGKYGEARVRAEDISGFLRVQSMIEAIDKAEKFAKPGNE
jgi:hypothetical protein